MKEVKKMSRLFTSESVTSGHPDKVCDQISDAILDAALKQDPESHVACEVCCTTGIVFVMGEITTKAQLDIQKIVRDTLCEIGYDSDESGFNGKTCSVLVALDKQSPDIAMGVNASAEYKGRLLEEGCPTDVFDQNGAGDQGMMFGYACNETEELMPLPIMLAHKLAKRLEYVRKRGIIKNLRPDGKTQVTVEYDSHGKAVRVDTIVISAQHSEDMELEELEGEIIRKVIEPVVDARLIDGFTKIFVNPTGRFVIGGPQGDSGLTGRKIIVDTYGGAGRHGGGAFSGKDPTKVDRSGAYMARYIAKTVVAAGLAEKCEVQIAYAIGVANPVSVYVNTFKTGKMKDRHIEMLVEEAFDLRPSAIIQRFDLLRPIYKETSAYGHFGKDEMPWEDVSEAVDEVKYLIKNTCFKRLVRGFLR